MAQVVSYDMSEFHSEEVPSKPKEGIVDILQKCHNLANNIYDTTSSIARVLIGDNEVKELNTTPECIIDDLLFLQEKLTIIEKILATVNHSI